MGIIIDILVILIILICMFIGYKRGLVNVIVGFLAFIIALVLAAILYNPISNLIIDNTKLDDNIRNGIYEKIKDEDIEESENGIIEFANQYILSDVKDATAEMIAESISELAIQVITFIIILIATRIILIFANTVLSAITNLPIIKQFNKAGGTIYGILQGIVINYLIFAILLIVVQMTSIDSRNINDTINESKLGSILYNENIIVNLVK